MMKKSLPLFAISGLTLAINSIYVHSAESLETVIVTASKIKENVQETAISMESISAEKLSDAGVNSLIDIAKITPGLQLEQSGGGLSATVRIRGIGTPGFSLLDPSAPIFIDGVAQGRTGAGFQDLLDVSRVEVLRGPQNTLYGRNSTAGAINVWTKEASTRNWEGSAQLQVGNFNDRELKASLNVPMVENMLAGRFGIFSTKQDGYTTNVMTGKTGNGYADRDGGRAKILITPSDDLKIQWITDYSKSINRPLETVVTYPGIIATYAGDPAFPMASNPQYSGAELVGGLPKQDPYSDESYSNGSWTEDKNFATSVTVSWDITSGFLANHSLTSITAYQKYENEQYLDKSPGALQWANAAGISETRSWSQELRISSEALDNWKYVAGIYYYGELVDSDQHTDKLFLDNLSALSQGLYFDPNRPSATQNLTNSFSHSNLRQDNAAIFGQATYNFSDQFSLTAGLRGSWVKKQGDSDVDADIRVPTFDPPPQAPYFLLKQHFILINDQTQTERDLSGVLKARYFLDEDIMFYASYDRGFKPGGFNRLVGSNSASKPTTFKKENSNNYEIGLKSKWLDNRLQANMSLFYLDFIDYHNQVTDPNSSSIIVENVKSVTTKGIEIDIQALLGDYINAGVGLAYLDPEVADDKVAKGQDTDPSRPGRSSTLVNGQTLKDTSQYSANIFAEYTHPLGKGLAEAFIRGDLSYRSEYLLANQGLNYARSIEQGGYSLTNLRFGIRKLEEHWQLTAWIKNLTDKEYAANAGIGLGYLSDGESITRGAPRTYGITVQYDY